MRSKTACMDSGTTYASNIAQCKEGDPMKGGRDKRSDIVAEPHVRRCYDLMLSFQRMDAFTWVGSGKGLPDLHANELPV